MPNRKVNNKGRGSGIIYAVIVLTIMTTVLAGGALAKYIKDNTYAKNVLAAKEFYFTSNMLTEDGETYVISPDSYGNASVTFTLGNNADELRFAEDDVAYTVVASGGTLSADSGILESGRMTVDSIRLSGMTKGQTYTVTATGNAGYEKTLSATFTVAGDDAGVYKSVVQNNHYVLLTVWTGNIKGDAVIVFPSGLIPDNTDTAMRTAMTNDRSVTDTVNFKKGYSSHAYRFFIDGASGISADSFDVRVDNVTAAPAVPE